MRNFKFKSGVGLLLFASLLFASCGETEEVTPPQVTDGETVEVRQEIHINVLPMQSVGTPATRAANNRAEKGEAIGVTYGSDATTRAQAGSDPMTDAEAKINNAYILQFDGTAPTSVLKFSKSLTVAELTGGSVISCSFQMTAGVKNRVYVVANVPSTKTLTVNTTTLADFEAPVTFTPVLSVSGLPMSAMQDIGVGDVFEVFQLRSRLAKLTFTTSAGSLKLKGLPSGYSFANQSASDATVRPTGITYDNTTGVALTPGTAYYVPENLSGYVQLSSPAVRCSDFAPKNSMYVEITNSGTVYQVYLGDSSASNFNFVGGYAYNIKTTLYGTSDFDWRVVSSRTIIDLNENGTANCYIVNVDNRWYSFNGTVMGNGRAAILPTDMDRVHSIAADVIPSPLRPASAEVLWETQNTATAPTVGSIVNNAVHVAKGKVLFKSGSTQGNAVIAARNAAGDIIWSWHIWRTNTDPTASPITLKDITDGADFTVKGVQIMDRNLGALVATTEATVASLGLCYQWGRKDPFLGSTGATLSSTTYTGFAKATNIDFATDVFFSMVSVEVAIAHPTTFYCANSDWCSSRNDNLWGTPLTSIGTINNGSKEYDTYTINKGSKSIYDPCPVGWRVPPSITFYNAANPGSDFSQGWDLAGKLTETGTSLFIIASGLRLKGDGGLYAVGGNGYYWTSTPCATKAEDGNNLTFGGYGVLPMVQNSRAFGSSCRCVKEF